MSNVFNTVMYRKPKRNSFNLSHDKKLSLDFGKLVPVMCQEVLPSDKFQITSESLIRLAPLIAPVMHRMNTYIHFFFVPNRIIWDGWEEFISGGEDGNSNIQHPLCTINEVPMGSVADYLGMSTYRPAGNVGNFDVSALPIAAYNKIFNEYYRDQNLQTEIIDYCEEGDNNALLEDCLLDQPYYRAWRHDYFTSALPFAQKGAAVTLPLGDTASLQMTDYADPSDSTKIIHHGNSNMVAGNLQTTAGVPDPDDDGLFRVPVVAGIDYGRVDVTGHTFVDLSEATAATINDLRRAMKLQEWLEKNARGGSRYVELLYVHFGVKSRDSRLQRPEYLGGSKSPIVISEVVQSSSPQSDEDTPQGNLSGHAIGLAKSGAVNRYFEEHGWIIGVMSIMPEPAYSQGLQRQFFKFDRFDYFWQEFAHIGEQEVLNKEIYNFTFDGQNEEVFGYTPRYSEYRFIPSTVHGDFKGALNFWHFGRYFDNRPLLNSSFIQCNPGKRIFAVQDLPASDEDPTAVKQWHTIYAHVMHKVTAIRPIPKFGIPSF